MKIFYAIRFLDVPASPPHAADACYRVAYGVEHWGPEPTYVFKIQMVYGGVVAGRRSPSFPRGSDDFERICAAMATLKQSAVAGSASANNGTSASPLDAEGVLAP